MKLAWPESQNRSISGCGNITGRVSGSGEGASLAAGACCTGTGSCARTVGAAQAKATSQLVARTVRCVTNRPILILGNGLRRSRPASNNKYGRINGRPLQADECRARDEAQNESLEAP